jgi:hypothetical protein
MAILQQLTVTLVEAPITPANRSSLTTGARVSEILPKTNIAHQPKNNATDRVAEPRYTRRAVGETIHSVGMYSYFSSDIQVTEGEHTVSVEKTGFTKWKLKVSGGSSVHLSAELEKSVNR